MSSPYSSFFLDDAISNVEFTNVDISGVELSPLFNEQFDFDASLEELHHVTAGQDYDEPFGFDASSLDAFPAGQTSFLDDAFVGQDLDAGFPGINFALDSVERLISVSPAPYAPNEASETLGPAVPDPASVHSERTISASPTPERAPPGAIYAGYRGLFKDGAAAKAHRQASKRPANKDPHLSYIKKHKREHWVRRIYTSIIDPSCSEDSAKSVHLKRFTQVKELDATDLEATAHHVFDKACQVHEKGWTRPLVYHKEAVRGKLADKSKYSVESRLQAICDVLLTNKSACNDALQGGLTLVKLCYNPEQRKVGKKGNNSGNEARARRLRLAAEALVEAQKKKAAGEKLTAKEKAVLEKEEAEVEAEKGVVKSEKESEVKTYSEEGAEEAAAEE